jgi:hypothetical protein
VNCTEDVVREHLLNLLNQSYRNARSRRKQSLAISEIKRGLKKTGYREQDIVGALTFLIDTGWVKEERVERKFFIKGRLATTEQIIYRISDIGIVHFSGPSKFPSPNQFNGINITNVRGVTVVGNSNLVQIKHKDLYEGLDDLGQMIRASSNLSDEEKVEDQSDLETIKSQLVKSTPDKTIVKSVWDSLKDRLSEFSELAGAISSIVPLIRLFTG